MISRIGVARGSGRACRAGVAASVLALTASIGCISTGSVSHSTSPSLQGGGAVAVSEPSVPQLQRMKVTLVPSVREVPALVSVTYDAPPEGLRLKKDAPYALVVTATGTGNLRGDAWLERSGTVVARTPFRYDRQADIYRASVLLDGAAVESGDYEVRGGLESLDPLTAEPPLHIEVEQSIPAGLLSEVQSFNAYFETDSSDLSDDSRAAVQALAQRLQPHVAGIRAIVVEGHCDTRGSEIHNLDLGASRAAGIMKILADSLPGVSVGVRSLGSENPDPAGATEQDFAKNRWSRIRIEAR